MWRWGSLVASSRALKRRATPLRVMWSMDAYMNAATGEDQAGPGPKTKTETLKLFDEAVRSDFFWSYLALGPQIIPQTGGSSADPIPQGPQVIDGPCVVRLSAPNTLPAAVPVAVAVAASSQPAAKDFIIIVIGACENLSSWSAACPCHGTDLIGREASRNGNVRRRAIDKSIRAQAGRSSRSRWNEPRPSYLFKCQMSGRRSCEFAAGIFLEFCQEESGLNDWNETINEMDDDDG